MPYPHIDQYRHELDELIRFGGSEGELNIRPAFQNCLAAYCRAHRESLALVPELRARAGVIPDGTVKDTLRMARGYWEAKDTDDDLDAEISRKFARGYPRDNILFEDSRRAVLIQNGEEAMRADMSRDADLHRLIRRFLDYELPQIEEFKRAQTQFAQDLPEVLDSLRESIDDAESGNENYRAEAADFLDLCKQSIGPDVSADDVREMLIQHILTRDIFLRVFGDVQFHQENDIARRLDALEKTFFTGQVRRDAIDRLRTYYGAIGRAADEIADYAEKQAFLKRMYEDFYKTYNPEAADRLGVVYTPNEIVDFMIRAADALLTRHFDRTLADKGVQILDPATGTGTFVTSLIEYLPADSVERKYQDEIHANEVAILPYYIANLNIEYTYRERTGRYLEFPNLCFVDTLDNMAWQQSGASGGAVGNRQAVLDIGGFSSENRKRVQTQNEKTISVVIGNPPYNANQRNANDNNKNREYPEIDQRVSETYVAASSAQKTKQYDMYKRFIRWASDRLADDGIIAFITNRSYIDSRQDDGFRKIARDEFSDLYIIDLGGDVRKNGKVGNVFGIMTGVAIGFFVRRSDFAGEGEIHYYALDDAMSGADKLAELKGLDIAKVDFMEITPDDKHDWLNRGNPHFPNLLTLADRKTKLAKSKDDEQAVFRLYTPGVATNRDEWVYDFALGNLLKKTAFFAKTYNNALDAGDDSYSPVIKWSRDLQNKFQQGRRIDYNPDDCVPSLYRPFTVKHHFVNSTMNDVLTKNHHEMFGADLRQPNKVICFSMRGAPFRALASNRLMDLHFTGDTQCLPLYRYTKEGERVPNITDWAIRHINDYYRERWGGEFFGETYPNGIAAEDIFAYAYAVLHDPVYRYDYATDLLREFPRLPLYHDFDIWARMGNRLLDLHLNFETAEPHPLERRDKPASANGAPPTPRLKADKERGIIVIDDQTTLSGIPEDAWRYKLGNRSALEWVLDQHKEKKPRDPTIRAQFNNYRLSARKESLIALLARVCAVSVATMEIVDGMAYWDGPHLVVFGDRDQDELAMLALSQWANDPDDAEWMAQWLEM